MAKNKRTRGDRSARPSSSPAPSDAASVSASVAASGSPADSASTSHAPAPRRRRGATRHDAARDPQFWFGFHVAWAKLAIGRVIVFGLLALDALLAIRHAPRYGAGGFNVAQLPWLDALGPTRGSYEVAQLINAYLFVLVACGVATSYALPAAAAIYSWLYFGSQLDSYQHHYLVAILLVIACGVPWRRRDADAAATPIATWALRLMLVELGIMYLWAAISKLNHVWLDGTLLTQQISGPIGALIAHTVGMRVAAIGVIVAELTLAVTVWQPRAWWLAAPLGLAFHVGIAFTGLEIGLFAWLMVGLYAFVIPDRVWLAIASTTPARAVRSIADRAISEVAGIGVWLIWVVAIVVGIALALGCRFEHAIAIAAGATLGLVIAGGAAFVGRGRARVLAWIAVAHVLAILLWVGVDRTTSVAADYYRFWGGSARRLGDTVAAERAYAHVVDIDPADPNGHFQLAHLMLARADAATTADRALAELRATERLEPHRARAWLEQARWLAHENRVTDAIAAVRAAAVAEPDNTEVAGLLARLTGGAKPPSPPAAPLSASTSHAHDDDANAEPTP